MRLLFVTLESDWPLRTGGQIRQWNTLQGLLQCGDVDVVVPSVSGAAGVERGLRQLPSCDWS